MKAEILSNLEVLTLTIYGEARGEPIEGQIAVGNVIRNRGSNYKDQCLAPRQFSCWNNDDPNRPLLEEMVEKLIMGQIIDDIVYNQCLWVAEGLYNEVILDNTGGAKHYITSRLFDSTRPSWAKNPEHSIKIGHQVFFNA